MATAYKILGQSNPSATTETDLYAVPSATETIVSSIIVCNQAASAGTFRISVSADGAATAAKDYLYYDVSIPANDTFIATVGLTIDATDKIRVYASSANMSFSAWGSEIS